MPEEFYSRIEGFLKDLSGASVTDDEGGVSENSFDECACAGQRYCPECRELNEGAVLTKR